MKYDLKDLLIFSYAAKLKSFFETSKATGISKTIVSSRIKELEKKMGISLFVRNTRAVNLTTDGEEFLKYCNAILEKTNNLDDFIEGCKEIKGTLRIAIPPYFSRRHIAPYLKEFCEKYPKLQLDIFPTETPLDIIAKNYDIQIRIQIPEEDLEVTRIMGNKKVVCASKEYVQEFGGPKTPQDLLNHNCLIFAENNIWNFRKIDTREIIEMTNLKGNIKCQNGEIIKELLLNNVGITLKSIVDIKNEITDGLLVQLLKGYEVLNETEFYATYARGRNLSPKIKAFINFFRKKNFKNNFISY